jgi:hypothetical protein
MKAVSEMKKVHQLLYDGKVNLGLSMVNKYLRESSEGEWEERGKNGGREGGGRERTDRSQIS